MSWSISLVGMPAAVAAHYAESAARQTCQEPEESVKAATVTLVTAACSGMPEGTAVRVLASGSQWKDGAAVRSQSVSLQFDTLGALVTAAPEPPAATTPAA